MSLTVKAYLEQDRAEPEIRRFVVDQGASTNYEYFSQKIARVFPTLSGKTFRLYWKDSENENIAFDSDEELIEALGCLTSDIFKVYVRVLKQEEKKNDEQDGSGVFHPGVTCDGCEGAINGNRYKCLQCPDYDLCEPCKQTDLHREHNMMCITHPFGFPPFWAGGHGRGHHGRRGHHWGGPSGCFGPQGRGGQHCKGKRGWFRNFMEQCQQQAAAANAGQPTTSQQQEQPTGGANGQGQCPFTGGDQPQDFLRNVGEQVAAMLDPLGIDVQVDVEHNGQRKKCGTTDQNKPESTADKPTNEQNTNAPENTTEMDTNITSPDNKKGSASPDGSGSGEDDWTMVNDQAGDNGGVAKKKTPEPAAGGANLYPDLPPVEPHVSQAREQMLAMGFRDDAGWLTRLLISVNGNISKALDSLRPGMSN